MITIDKNDVLPFTYLTYLSTIPDKGKLIRYCLSVHKWCRPPAIFLCCRQTYNYIHDHQNCTWWLIEVVDFSAIVASPLEFIYLLSSNHILGLILDYHYLYGMSFVGILWETTVCCFITLRRKDGRCVYKTFTVI